MGDQEVSFHVPLPGSRRTHKFTFALLATVMEQEGCIKFKQAQDKQGDDYIMRILYRKEMEKQPDPKAVEARINTEIGFLKLIEHRHVLKVFQVHPTPERIYIVTEPTHLTLAEYMKEPLPHAEIKQRFTELLSATAHLHGMGLAHRALSPQTVLVDPDTGIKVSGLSSATLQSSRKLLTDRPSLIDQDYAAPELIKGNQEYSGKMADAWSCGGILYFMFTGRAPVDGLEKIGDIPAPAQDLVRSLTAESTAAADSGSRLTITAARMHPWFESDKRRISDAPQPLSRAAVRRSFRQVGDALGGTGGNSVLDGMGIPADVADEEREVTGEPAIVDETFSPLPQGRRKKPDQIDVDKGGAELEPLESRTPGDMPLSPTAPASPASRTKGLLGKVGDVLADTDGKVEDDGVCMSPMGAQSKKPRGFSPESDKMSAPAQPGTMPESVVAAAIEKVVEENEDYMRRTNLQPVLTDMIIFLLGCKPRGPELNEKLLKWARATKARRAQ
eukprot:Hpha_TRINITY_DN10549_c0_g1::TRINITY_DN10549_c0_g1_i1::g.31283::m.31283/K08796/BRSK; BR serine/threonine kinase